MAKQAKDPERQARAKQTKAQMIARGWLSDDGITWLHHKRGGSLYLVAGDGRVKVGKALTKRLGTRLAEHSANGLTEVVWTLNYPVGGHRNVDLDELACIDAIREAFPPLEKTDGLDGFRESVWSDDPQAVLVVVRRALGS
jgi:hypothetical protein